MADFLLIHGSCHGAWCWRDLIAPLEALGHTARTIDMPGHGSDTTPISEVTLDACGNAILAASTPDTLIVGHSWGGYPISAAAEANPDAMRGLIYLCAYLPISGMSLVDMRKLSKDQPLTGAVNRSDDMTTLTIVPDRIRDLFYHDCSDEVVAFATASLRPQIIKPQVTPLTVTERFASVPKSYIQTLHDHTIPPDFQLELAKDIPEDRIYSIPTSHSPFFADPKGLAALLDQISKQL
ncbi:MAG: alpha/beta fold hydrolase [Rhodobacteraceae bacterium]|nr:alpha/beta fold hydrolase [Paracoccaceae bacterium]